MPIPKRILQTFLDPSLVSEVRSLGAAGGFSGARFWRIESHLGSLCLRQWPREHPTPGQLGFIHKVLAHVGANGVDFVPVPMHTLTGGSWTEIDGHLWEITPWLPGAADYWEDPNRKRLAGAMRVLARFHLAASEIAEFNSIGVSPSIGQRIALLRELVSFEAATIQQSLVASGCSPDLSTRGLRIMEHFWKRADGVGSVLAGAANLPIRLQPVIRDIWHDHVLFQGDHVSGVVDFGAMRVDTVVADLSRLLCSFLLETTADKDFALETYQSVRPLTEHETALRDAFDASTPLLSGMNWLRWIIVQRRRFEDWDRVLRRLDQILLQLDR